MHNGSHSAGGSNNTVFLASLVQGDGCTAKINAGTAVLHLLLAQRVMEDGSNISHTIVFGRMPLVASSWQIARVGGTNSRCSG